MEYDEAPPSVLQEPTPMVPSVFHLEGDVMTSEEDFEVTGEEATVLGGASQSGVFSNNLGRPRVSVNRRNLENERVGNTVGRNAVGSSGGGLNKRVYGREHNS